MSRVLPSGDSGALIRLSFLFVSAAAAGSLIDYSRSTTVSRVLSNWVLAYQNNLSSKMQTAKDQVILFEQLNRLRGQLSGPLGLALLDLPWSIVFTIGLFYINAMLGYLAILLLLATFVTGAVGSYLSSYSRRKAAMAQSPLRRVLANPGGLLFTSVQSQQATLAMRNVVASAGAAVEAAIIAGAVGHFMRQISQAILIAVTAIMVSNENMAVGSLLAATMLFSRAVGPVEKCSDLSSLIEVFRQICQLSRVRNEAGALVTNEKQFVSDLTGNLSLVRVFVQSHPGSPLLLAGVNLLTKAGELTILGGPSGSGKSLILAVIAGFVRPSDGLLKLDQYSIVDLDPGIVRDLIGYLPPSPYFSDGSISQFISGGKTMDFEAVTRASTAVGIHDTIERLPLSYETLLAASCDFLSRGQQQQLHLARALYKAPKLILLDEPTAYLDEISEERFATALNEVRCNGSNIIASTRSARVIAMLDRMVFVEAGQVAAEYTRGEIEANVFHQQLEGA